jgi:glyoxylase-like metal-dependent hydrolase (beta-lactamase superfamily II)
MKYIFSIVITLSIFSAAAQNFHSKHFDTKRLAPNVYAAIAKNGGAAICNAAVIDLGNEVLVFDPFMTPQAATDLLHFIQTNIKKPVKYVVNSHAHNDHIRGNQVFENATIIATPSIAESILKTEPVEIADEKKQAPARARYYDSLPPAKDSWQRTEDSIWKGYYNGMVASHPVLKTTLPTVLFSDSLAIVGTNTTVKLLTYGDGHTPSDLFLYLPEENIAFMGDLLFVNYHPWLGDSKPSDWINYLQKVQQLNVKTLVPGHGAVGNGDDVEAMINYMEAVGKIVTEARGQNISNEQILAKIPVQFTAWHLRNFFVPNVRILMSQQQTKN